MRVRKNVWRLPAGDQTLLWYGKAVAAMKERAPTDPLSWHYQAAMHGIRPLPAAMKQFWGQCQHGSGFFLPWHRMYLLRFEQIVAAHVKAAGGPEWSLPYWDYSVPEHRALPPAFREPASPLFVAQRGQGWNGGRQLVEEAVDLQSLGQVGDDFFGDEQPAHSGNEPGALELTPHNAVHASIGGWMGDPDTAAADPIFWLHHCNIDRLWDVWLKRDPENNKNPTAALWLDGVKFAFHDDKAQAVAMTSRQILAGLDYSYEDISDPFGNAAGFAAPGAPRPAMSKAARELVGSTAQPVTLGETAQDVHVATPITPAQFRAAASPAAFIAPDAKAHQLVHKVWLRLEHVTSTAVCPTYDVLVHGKRVGRIAMFGIAQASDPDGEHGGAGQNFSLDITRVYHELFDQQVIDPDKLEVSFAPVEPAANATVTVGRIGLYFA